MRRLLVAVATCIGLIGVLPSLPANAASTSQQGPPRVSVMYHHDVVARMSPISFCWTYTQGNGGYGLCADGVSGYGDAIAVHGPARVTFRIHYAAKPKSWQVWAGRRVTGRGWNERSVNPRRLPVRLVPHRSHGQVVAWDAIVRLAQRDRDYYLDVGGNWAAGDASYRLHLAT